MCRIILSQLIIFFFQTVAKQHADKSIQKKIEYLSIHRLPRSYVFCYMKAHVAKPTQQCHTHNTHTYIQLKQIHTFIHSHKIPTHKCAIEHRVLATSLLHDRATQRHNRYLPCGEKDVETIGLLEERVQDTG